MKLPLILPGMSSLHVVSVQRGIRLCTERCFIIGRVVIQDLDVCVLTFQATVHRL